MAKKKTKKRVSPLYKYLLGGPVGMGAPDPYAWEKQAFMSQHPIEPEAPATEAKGPTKGQKAMAGVGAVAQEIGGMVGSVGHDLFQVGVSALNALIPDNADYKRPTPEMAYNPNPYGTGSSALYDYGGNMPSPFRANQGMVMPMANGEMQVEGNQYSFLSPETINLGGASHADGGTNVSYGGNMVEAEAGEPISIGQDGQAVVWGNMYVPNTNMKFKSAAKKIAKEETKITKTLGKATKLLQGSNPMNPTEALAFNSGRALNDAAAQKQAVVSAQKDSLATLQQAMLDYSEATGIKPDKLGKQMKKGGKMPNGGAFPYGVHREDISKGKMTGWQEVPNMPPVSPYTPPITPYELPNVDFTAKRNRPAIPLEGVTKQGFRNRPSLPPTQGGMTATSPLPSPTGRPVPPPRNTGMPRPIPGEPMNPLSANLGRPTPQARPVHPKNIHSVSWDRFQDKNGRTSLLPIYQGDWTESQKSAHQMALPTNYGDMEVLRGDAYKIALEHMERLNPKKYGGCMECGGQFEDGGQFYPIAGEEYGIASYPIFPPENNENLPMAASGFHLNPAHKGWCTPMTKKTCTGKRRQFAINAKNHFKKQAKDGASILAQYAANPISKYAPTPSEMGRVPLNDPNISGQIQAVGAGKRAEERAMQARVAARQKAVKGVDSRSHFMSMPLTDEARHEEALALQQRGRIFPNEEHWFDEYLNPLQAAYNLGSGLASAADPTNKDPWKVPKGIAAPLMAGTLSKFGPQSRTLTEMDDMIADQFRRRPSGPRTLSKTDRELQQRFADMDAKLKELEGYTAPRTVEQLLNTDLGTLRPASNAQHRISDEGFNTMFSTPEGTFTPAGPYQQTSTFYPYDVPGGSSFNNEMFNASRTNWEEYLDESLKAGISGKDAADEYLRQFKQHDAPEMLRRMGKKPVKADQFPINKNKYGGELGGVGDEVDLTPEQMAYYRSLGYEFE